jgi:hypothetical protein
MFNRTFQVKLSTPFLCKSRCPRCGGEGKKYYWIKNPSLFKSPEALRIMLESFGKYIKRFCTSYYLEDSPKDYKTTSAFKFGQLYNNYNPKVYKNRGVKSSNYYVEFLACECGHMSWGFNNESDNSRPELLNRKAKKYFPKKFNLKY